MDIRKKQRAVVDALEEVKGRDIIVLNTERLSPFFERVIIATGDSTRQVKALADNVQRKLREQGAKGIRVEGSDTAEWVLVDLSDTVVHIMHPTTRLYYNLEEIWGGKAVTLKPLVTTGSRALPKAKAAAPGPKASAPKPKASTTKRKATAEPKAATRGPKATTARSKAGAPKAKPKAPARRTKVATKSRSPARTPRQPVRKRP